MISIEATIKRILFDEPNRYSESGLNFIIAKAELNHVTSLSDENSLITIKGDILGAILYESYRFFGEYKLDEKRGEQYFKFMSYHVISPVNKKGCAKYFINYINNIGLVYSNQIIEHFGDDTINILLENPHRVKEVPDLPERAQLSVISHFSSSTAHDAATIAELSATFEGHTVSHKIIELLAQRFHSSAMTILQENPYILTNYPRIGWDTVDAIARSKFNIGLKSRIRVVSAIEEVMKRQSDLGHTYCGPHDLDLEFFKLANCRIEKEWYKWASDDNVIQIDLDDKGKTCYQLVSHYLAERSIARNIIRLQENAYSVEVPVSFLGLEDEQLEAVRVISNNGVSILAGIPGSGKTFTVAKYASELHHLNESIGFNFCAPTGRAAKRLKELLDYHNPENTFDCQTVHRMLGWAFSRESAGVPEADSRRNRGRARFEYQDGENRLDVGTYVLEESSMNDIFMMSALFDKIPSGSRVIIVGDPYQLQSIRAGAFIRDLLAAPIPSVCLETPRRNAGRIVQSCYNVKNGVPPRPAKKFDLDSDPPENYVHIECEAPEEIHDVIIELHKKAKINPFLDMQVISPQKEIAFIGCNDLNKSLSRLLNPSQRKILVRGKESFPFSIGDKVMRTKNGMVTLLSQVGLRPNIDLDLYSEGDDEDGENFDIFDNGDEGESVEFEGDRYIISNCRVVNGDIGIILGGLRINNRLNIVVGFKNPDRICAVPSSDHKIDLAFAATVHKFQGSGAHCVIAPVHTSFYWDSKNNTGLFSRELLYTLLSRAEIKLITVGPFTAIRAAVSRKTIHQRRTRLTSFILEEIRKRNERTLGDDVLHDSGTADVCGLAVRNTHGHEE